MRIGSPSFWVLLLILTWRTVAAESVRIHPASAMVHIGGVDGVFPDAATDYHITMVRGEREGFQFGVSPGGNAAELVRSVSVEVIGDGHPSVALFRVLAVNHTAPIDDKTFKVPPRRLGLIPDVLMPLRGVPADNGDTAAPFKPGEVPLTYYVEFTTDANSAAGNHNYTVNVGSATGASALTVHVNVEPVTIPARLPFRTAIDWGFSLQDYFGRPLTVAEKAVFWNFCLDQRLSPCSFFGSEPDPAPAYAAELKDRGLSVVNLFHARNRQFSDAEKKKYATLLAGWRTELKKSSMENDAVVLLADEPAPKYAPVARENGAWIKSQFPEAKLWVATRPGPPWDEFTDLFDPVTVHSTEIYAPHSHDEFALRRWLQVRPSGEYWWFLSVEPYGPYVNVRLDDLPIEARVAGWQSAQAGVDGFEYFWIADWSHNKDNEKTAWPERAAKWQTSLSGAGTLCYPGEKNDPMPSLRLVNLRDGIEDWALLEQLCPRHSTMQSAPGMNSVTKSPGEYTTDPAVLLAARKHVIEALLARDAKK